MWNVKIIIKTLAISLQIFAVCGLTGHNLSADCSNHCSQQDATSSCWTETQKYYDENLVNAINDWVAVQVNIDQWNLRHTEGYKSPPENITEDTTARISRFVPSDGPLTKDRLVDALVSFVNLTFTISKEKLFTGIPEFVCPIPCNYEWRLWEYLFIASVLVNIAMILVVIPFIVKSERREKQMYAKQVSMTQILKPASKSRHASAAVS